MKPAEEGETLGVRAGGAEDWAARILAASDALSAYFAGELAAIDALAVASFGTPFQREVWQELCRIPYGETISYGELARRIGIVEPRASGAPGGDDVVLAVGECQLEVSVGIADRLGDPALELRLGEDRDARSGDAGARREHVAGEPPRADAELAKAGFERTRHVG